MGWNYLCLGLITHRFYISIVRISYRNRHSCSSRRSAIALHKVKRTSLKSALLLLHSLDQATEGPWIHEGCWLVHP